MKAGSSAQAQVNHNKRVHDAAASTYEELHVEIYNPTEQARISCALGEAVASLSSGALEPRVLDFGAGTGNLSSHLLALGLRVVAADVSVKSLAELAARNGNCNRLETAELNGIDLSEFPANSFDMVATYSVLHHVPDYLTAVKEFVRVVKPGGIIVIDHEVAPIFWARDPEYVRYRAELDHATGPRPVLLLTDRVLQKVNKLFSIAAWRRSIDSRLFGLSEEGDIHVKEDDHIEWPLIERILVVGCTIVSARDYLVCREKSADRPIHRRFDGICADMRIVIARKCG